MKLINTWNKTVILRHNAKIADFFPGIAVEDMDDVNLLSQTEQTQPKDSNNRSVTDLTSVAEKLV